MRRAALVLPLLLLAVPPAASEVHAHPCQPQVLHQYAVAAAFAIEVEPVGRWGSGAQTAKDLNTGDCNGDLVPADPDGDPDGGVGSAYLPEGHHDHAYVCVADFSGLPVHMVVANEDGTDGSSGFDECLPRPEGNVWVMVEAGVFETSPGVFVVSAPTVGFVYTTDSPEGGLSPLP